MVQKDLLKFSTLVMSPLYLHYQREPDEDLNALYFRLLADLELADLERAAVQAMLRLTFFPKVAELRGLVLGDEEERAAIAWARAHNAALRGYGTIRPLDFGDPVLHAAVTGMGGWRALYALGNRDAEGVDAAVARKEFMQLYIAYLHRGVPPETPETLHMIRSMVGNPIKLDALGEAPKKKALPPADKKKEKLIPAPPEFLAAIGSLGTKAPPPAVRNVVVDHEPTRQDVEDHENRKRAAINEFKSKVGDV